MSMSVADFCQAARQMPVRLREEHLAAQRRVVKAVGARLLDLSPVLTGQYRASHRANIGTKDPSYYEPRPREGIDPIVPSPVGYTGPTEQAMQFGALVVMSNNVPHAGAVENGCVFYAPYAVYMQAAVYAENQAVAECKAVTDAVLAGVR